MPRTVTAILVAADGAEYLRETLDAITMQTRLPDRLVVVQLGTNPVTTQIVDGIEPTVHTRVSPKAGFGHALAAGFRASGTSEEDEEWLWLLASDNAPEPGALEALVDAVEAAPSVVIAGPKQMQWDAPAYLRSFGESMTGFGMSVEFAEPELDQAQYDRHSDVLAVAAGGMFVRETLWRQLGGFDPALPAVDDALDFCVRARLAGHRVQLVPRARVRSAGIEAPGTRLLGVSTTAARRARLRREAQLHRRLTYAPLPVVPLHWLSIVPIAIVRAIGQLLRKQPGAAPAELFAAIVVATTCFAAVARARGRIRRTRAVGWGAIAPLRIGAKEVRHRRALARDNGPPGSRAEPVHFALDGGLAITLAAAAAGVILFWPLIGASALVGGGLLPLGDFDSLWRSVGWTFHPLGAGFTGPSDPFALVVALLGSLTFWHPSAAVVVLWVGALPIAAAGGWLATARFTRRPALRAIGGLLWAVSPTLLVALDTGRIAAVLVHLAVPFALIAGTQVRRSWTASAWLSLLGALVAACSPSLLPLLAFCWAAGVWLGVVRRTGIGVGRVLPVPLPTIALFAPLLFGHLKLGNPLGVLADPGPVLAGGDGTPHLLGLPDQLLVPLQLAAGWPTWASGTWEALTAPLGLTGGAAVLVVWCLGVPLLLLAVAGLFWPSRGLPARIGLAGVGGLVAAVLATRLQLVDDGTGAVSAWPGAGLSIAWLGALQAAVHGLDRLAAAGTLPFESRAGRAAGRLRTTSASVIGFTAVAALLTAVSPLLGGVLAGTAAVRAGSTSTAPALVAAEAAQHPTLGLLELRPRVDGGFRASVVRGGGTSLEQSSTLQTASDLGDTPSLARLVAGLVQPTSDDLKAGLDAFHIGYVLLQPAPKAAAATSSGVTAQGALAANPLLSAVSTGPSGTLYRYAALPADDHGVGSGPAPAQTPVGVFVLLLQGLPLGIAGLLALPTGRLAARLRPVPIVRAPRAEVLRDPGRPLPPLPRPAPLSPEQRMVLELDRLPQPEQVG